MLSYLLAALNLLASYCLSRRWRWGWYVAFVANIGWMGYAWVHHIGGMFWSGFIYVFIHVRALRHWED